MSEIAERARNMKAVEQSEKLWEKHFSHTETELSKKGMFCYGYEFGYADGERAIAESHAPQPQSNTQGEVYNYYVCEGCGSQVNGNELPEAWCEFGQSALREVGRKSRRIPLAAWCPDCQRNGAMK